MQEVCLHMGKSFMASETTGIQVMLWSSVQPSAEQGRQIYTSGKAIIKAIFALSMIWLHKSQEKRWQIIIIISSGVSANANAACCLSSQLYVWNKFQTQINWKRKKSQMAPSFWSALMLSAPGQMCDCFPCTNAAQSLLGVLSMSGKLQH